MEALGQARGAKDVITINAWAQTRGGGGASRRERDGGE
jgi:hypothetical protein